MTDSAQVRSGARRLFVAILSLVAATGTSTIAADAATPSLEQVLDRLSRMARFYESAALEFSCRETVRWIDFNSAGRPARRGKIRSNYLYASKDGEILREVRAPKRVKASDDIDRHMDRRGLRLVLERPYFWVLLFGVERQNKLRYTMGSVTDTRDGRVMRIDIQPVPPVVEDVNDWCAAIDVDLDTYQLVRAEGYKANDCVRRQRFLDLLQSNRELPVSVEERTFVVTEVRTEFGVEINDLRLPGDVRVTKKLFRVRGTPGHRTRRETAIRAVRQTYKDCRLYDVQARFIPPGSGEIGQEVGSAPQPPPGEVRITGRDTDTTDDPSDWPAVEVSDPGVLYEESFDWPSDSPDAIAEWRHMGWLIGKMENNDRIVGDWLSTAIWEGRVTDGHYELKNRIARGAPFTQTFHAEEGCADCPISVRVKLPANPWSRRSSAVGLLHGFAGTRSAYHAYVLTHQGYVRFMRRTENDFERLYSLKIQDFSHERFYDLHLTRTNGAFELRLDGKLIQTIEDDQVVGAPGIIAVNTGIFLLDDLVLFHP